jgi:molecular chaperone GrpE
MTDNQKELEEHDPAIAGSPAGDGPPAHPPTGEDDTPPADTLKEERDRYYDLLLRKTAEFDNYRKRVERERRELIAHATADVLTELLPVIDDLERALNVDVPGEQADGYRRGVELIHRRLLDMLRRRGVTLMEAVGQPFDPHRHQAVTYEPVDGKPDGEVIEEFARGYLIGERLLRPAMVKVAKA